MNSAHTFYSFCWKLNGSLLTIFGRLLPDETSEQRSISVNCDVGPGWSITSLLIAYQKSVCRWYTILPGQGIPYTQHHWPNVRPSQVNLWISSLEVLQLAGGPYPCIHTLAVNDIDNDNVVVILQYPIAIRQAGGATRFNNIYRYGYNNLNNSNFIPLNYRDHLAVLEASYGIDVEFYKTRPLTNAPVKMYDDYSYNNSGDFDFYSIVLDEAVKANDQNDNIN